MFAHPIYNPSGGSSLLSFDFSVIATNDTIIIGLIASLMLLSYVIAFDKGKLKLVFTSLLGEKNITQNVRDKINYTNRTTIVLFANYILCSALLATSISSAFEGVEFLFIPFTVAVSLILVISFLAKRLLIWLTGLLTGKRNEIQDYLFFHSIYTIAAGIALLPLISILHFSKINYELALTSCIIFLVLFFLLRVSISALLAIKYRISTIFYIFLYICSLEILPSVVLYKAFISEIL